MKLAHTLGASGPDIEFLLSAAALLAFGIIGMVQKIMKPVIAIILVLGGVALGIGAFAVGPSTTKKPASVAVSITSPTESEVLPAREPVEVTVDLEGATLTDSFESSDPTEGHIHVFVDDKLVSMPSSLTPRVRLAPGDHTITIEFVTADHSQFNPRVVDSVEVAAE